MKFRFNLQRVLEIRRLQEKEKQKAFMLALSELRTKEVELANMMERKMNFAGNMNLMTRLTVNEVAGHHHYLASLARSIDALRSEIDDITTAVEEKRRELLEAAKTRKALEKLREKRHEEHLHQELASEQEFLDEVAMRREWMSD